ncbi:hypothetical protein [Pedobacter sp. CFBP9032]|uniref:hypothetical protein n=1 Tax=Pedobacter sp. CFBP9032 TaxID=3096539 RepID=UPI002A6AEFEF|nr:hypothetical protein [Pedobacter sp. CFBP9032]MDY0907119.1 hypothetical protein [Pedobacter sp. CFBP9032]
MKQIAIYQVFITLFTFSSFANSQDTEGARKAAVVKSHQTKSIDAIYSSFSLSHAVKHKKIVGQFAYVESNELTGKFLAKFITKEIVPSIDYVSYAGSKKDAVVLGKQTFSLQNKIDPSSLVIHWVYNQDRKYLCLIGKGQSASGSGVQVSYFTLFELGKSAKASSCQEFTSRFGNINSLVSYDKNGNIGYLRIVNAKKMDQYLLTVNDIKTNKQLGERTLMLKYELNDKFSLLSN